MTRRSVRAVPAVLLALALTACASSVHRESAAVSRPEAQVSEPVVPSETVVLPGGSAEDLSVESSLAFFTAAPVAVVAAPDAHLRAASVAVALGVPVLVDEPGTDRVPAALAELGTQTVLAVGDPDVAAAEVEVVPVPEDDAELAERAGLGTEPASETVPAGEEVAAVGALEAGSPVLLRAEEAEEAADEPTEGSAPDDAAGLPYIGPPEPVATSAVVMATGAPEEAAAVGNARVAGATMQVVPGGDPRESSQTVQETAQNAPDVVVGLGEAFGDDETLAWRATTAATGTELPGGGQLVLPGKTYVALYGSPGTPSLGVLGEQDVPATVQRAAEHAEPYRALTDDEVVPALEIISTVASNVAGPDGNYSTELPVERLRPVVEAAGENGQYVVLDLQPGRTDFVTQAREYEELLRLPHVGLALDPEWRLRPDEVHLEQIGHVPVEEVNAVVAWLADLTREHSLPQKLLVLHAFRTSMLPGIEAVDQSRTELAVLVHADGQGGQGAKQSTWATLHAAAPNVQHWGWKNFYDEDSPMLTPEQTMAVEPAPEFVSYQ